MPSTSKIFDDVPAFESRERFAALAMQALLTGTQPNEFDTLEYEQKWAKLIARAAVSYADALCRELVER